MARILINLGTPPSGQDGDPVRTAFEKVNTMTSELYEGVGTPSAPLPINRGGTGAASLPAALRKAITSEQLTYAEAAAERIRTRAFDPINFVTDLDDSSSAQITGPGYVTLTTTGAKPPGWSYGVVETVLIPGDVCIQEFTGLNGVGGVTHPKYRRTGYGSTSTKWGPWALVSDSISATTAVEQGGIAWAGVVSGYLINKYVNGEVFMRGTAPTTKTFAVNEIANINVDLPVTLVNGAAGFGFAAVVVCQPSNVYDMYAPQACYLNTPSQFGFAMRNGGTVAQTFSPRIHVWGRWK